MTPEQEREYNKAASDWWGGHLRNFGRSMNPSNKEKLEEVPSWKTLKEVAMSGTPEITTAPTTAPTPASTTSPATPSTKTLPDVAAAASTTSKPFVDTAKWEGDVLQPYGTKRKPSPVVEQPTIKDGWTSDPNSNVYGGRILSMNPGQEGGGTGYVSGPARGSRDLRTIASENRMGRGQVGGYSFEGSDADFARFAQQPTMPALQDGNTIANKRPIYQQVRDRQEAIRPIEPPKYLGPESGLGWKTRLKKYESDLDAYNKVVNNKVAMDIEALREAGAGQRSIRQAEAENNRTALEQQKFLAQYPGQVLDNQIKLDDLANRQEVGALRNQLRTLTPGTPQYGEIERRLATLSGKFGEQKEPNVQMIEEPLDPTDPSSPLVKRPVRINRDESYSRLPESVAPTNVTAESLIQSDLLLAERYAKLSPEDRTRMIQEMNKRMAERQAQ